MNPAYSTTYNGTSIDPHAAGIGLLIFGSVMLFVLVFVLIVYIYLAVCLMKIAKKTNTENAWFAWIPILNIILMVQISKKPTWWIILSFIPVANIVVGVLVWMAISERLGKPDWLGILMIVPVINLVIPGYLAFSSSDIPTIQPPAQQPPVQQPPAV